ncbi:hypothetical protein C942_02222 [Photobacterium marinum]|uniref:Antitoxin Xre/MbcA/ParS-like toxin-binding domain-containing protein n=2 Tax=Photobacterium marinum TaxID=1056511 RepID=L8J789_9GAMM|nr:hypothetical protein C942_02222 [Photobacterium marinum]
MVSQGLCSRAYAEHWFTHEQIPAFDNQTPDHIVRTGQINALLDYIEVATLKPKSTQENVVEEDNYQIQVHGDSMGMNNPDKYS